MPELLRLSLSKFTFARNGTPTRRGIATRKYKHVRPFQCVLTEDNRRIVVKNGKDSLDICRVVNGMWQTSGGWGRIDRHDAVDAMLKYADAGLTTFDMADICMQHSCLLNRLALYFFFGFSHVSSPNWDSNCSSLYAGAGPFCQTQSLLGWVTCSLFES